MLCLWVKLEIPPMIVLKWIHCIVSTLCCFSITTCYSLRVHTLLRVLTRLRSNWELTSFLEIFFLGFWLKSFENVIWWMLFTFFHSMLFRRIVDVFLGCCRIARTMYAVHVFSLEIFKDSSSLGKHVVLYFPGVFIGTSSSIKLSFKD